MRINYSSREKQKADPAAVLSWSIFFLFFSFSISAQTTFVRKDSIPVFQNSQQLAFAWGGGMNYCQYSDIDLNLDGIKDLFVFDRTGNKITTYINLGTPNQASYRLAMEYAPKFPRMHDWVLLRDYNCDGKMDIFTSNASKVEVYKNVSTLATGLQFQLVTGGILTDLSPNSSHNIAPLNVSWIDLPAIRDVDGDGDLDILNYGVAGYQVEFHRNMSMENYGVCDSLKFRLETLCWGEYTESQLDATITLGTPCSNPPVANDNETHNTFLHAGSCLECINIDKDNDQDLLVGDLANVYINLVRNGGTNTYAIGDTIDDHYPGYDTPMNMEVFGCAFHLDINNDGKRDLLFSPNSGNGSNNIRSSWYYTNVGLDDSVRASFVSDNFLQGDMIDLGEGSYPVFFDYDHDGDMDLFIGNRGYYDPSGIPDPMIALYKNTGTATSPIFTHMSSDFAGLYTQQLGIPGLAPTFGDLDGDGDEDMIVGDVNGHIHFFRKDPGNDTNFVLAQTNYMSIDVGSFATPQLVDVDHDGVLDLLIGEQSGNVNYFHNTGTTTAPNFSSTPTIAVFGGVNVVQSGFTTGYSVPLLFQENGSSVLLVGSERGFLFRYDNIDGNLAGNFTLTDSLYVSSYEGGRIAPAVADLNNDGMFDVVIGNYSGGVSLFYGDNGVTVEEISPSLGFHLYPNPASGSVVIETGEAPAAAQMLSIYNLAGQEVVSEKISGQRTVVNTEALPAGIYICSMRDKNGLTVNKKLVISR